MKLVIFLLAFCVFETVIADEIDDYYRLTQKHVQYIVSPKERAIEAAVNVAAIQKIHPGNCKDLSSIPLKEVSDKAVEALQKCNDIAVKTKNLLEDKKCSEAAIATLRKDVQKIPSISECTARCAHKDCSDN